MDMSLDEIIRQKKLANNKNKNKKFGTTVTTTKAKSMLRKTLNKRIGRVADARNKIIQKNRAKIRDARDKLVEINRKNVVDAREKISSKKKTARVFKDHYSNGQNVTTLRTRPTTYRVPLKPAAAPSLPPKRVVDVRTPRGYVDYDNMERLEEEEFAAAARLSRTVKNDLTFGSSYGERRREHGMDSWNSDPFNVYEVTRARQERILTPELPPPPPKGILRNSTTRPRSPDLYERRYIPEVSSHLSYEMRSRLQKAPDPHASMGIFANPLKPPTMPTQTSSSGYRIVVSNLHTSVSKADIQELFEDVGPLYDSRIVRPGVAEVIYKSLADAERAVETYHNRQLDGLPMKCLLVNPRASNKPTAPAIRVSSSSRLNSGKTPLEIDIDALHKVLFRRN